MRSRLTAAALGAALALMGAGTAHAATPVTIAMAQPISTTCNGNQAMITAVLYNEGGPDEDAQVYLEPNPGFGGLGVPVQYNQPSPAAIHIPSGAQAVVHLPYENGSAVFDAIAVTHGAALPQDITGLEDMKTAKTAANSELSPGQYPVAPSGCTPPPWHPCPPNWQIDLYPVAQTCPVYVPPPPPSTHPSTHLSTTPSTHPSTHPAPKPSTVPSSTHSTTVTPAPTTKPLPTVTSSFTLVVQPTTTSTSTSVVVTALPTTPVASLAHTGKTSTSPLVWLALLLALSGAGLVLAGKRKGRRNH